MIKQQDPKNQKQQQDTTQPSQNKQTSAQKEEEIPIQLVDINNPAQIINKVTVQFETTKVRPFLLNYITKNLIKTNSYALLVPNVFNFYEKLIRSNLFKSIIIKQTQSSKLEEVNLLVKLQEKNLFFASFSQMFQPGQGASVNFRAGFNNLFKVFDKISLEFNKALDFTVKNQDLSLALDFPVFINNTMNSSGYVYGQRYINKYIDEEHSKQFFRIMLGADQMQYFQIENDNRTNFINMQKLNEQNQEQILKQEILPNRKISFKYAWNLMNTITRKKMFKGQYLNQSLELAVPVASLSQANFIKMQLFYRGYCKLNKFVSKISQRIYQNCNLENNLEVGFISQLLKNYDRNQSVRTNDKFIFENFRGFKSINQNDERDYLGNTNFLKFCTKFIFYDYPFLQNTHVLPFLHFSGLFTYQPSQFGKKNLVEDQKIIQVNQQQLKKQEILQRVNNNLRLSAGIGISAIFSEIARLELLYNFYHKSVNKDVTTNFQLRISVND